MKYMLIEVEERCIAAPKYFDTHDAAHDEMCRRIAEIYGITLAEAKRPYLQCDLSGDIVVCYDAAWGERHGKYCDWKIFTIERDAL